MTRLAIVGSRHFARLDLVRSYVDSLPKDTVVISGGAIGVDTVAEAQARYRGLEVDILCPDWKGLGPNAGLARNTTIVEHADWVVAFWDGTSRGTRDTIEKAQAAGKLLHVCRP